jgi:hypothetical protein
VGVALLGIVWNRRRHHHQHRNARYSRQGMREMELASWKLDDHDGIL